MSLKKLILSDRDLRKCYACNCSTAPLCTVNGEVCNECFDIYRFKHKQFNRSNLVCIGFLKDYVEDESEPVSPTNAKMYIPKNPKVQVIEVPGDGDCLYKCVEMALPGDAQITVTDLRALVANSQTQETFDNYKEVYPPLAKLKTLQSFRNFIKRCGAKVGPDKCLWGDENALQIISNEYILHFAIFSAGGGLIQLVEPELDTSVPSSYMKRYVLLLLDNRNDTNEHYYLLKFDNKRLISEPVWQSMLAILNHHRIPSQ